MAQVPENLVPPDVQTTPITDGIYFGQTINDLTGGLEVLLLPAFLGSQCETAAAAEGQQCDGGIFVGGGPTYTLPLASDAFISLNLGAVDTNVRVDAAEMFKLINGDPLAPNAPTNIQPFGGAVVTVVGGVATRVEQFFTP